MTESTTDTKTCAYEACGCTLEETLDHCGPTCRLGIGDETEPCKCGHGECSATVGDAAVDPQRPV